MYIIINQTLLNMYSFFTLSSKQRDQQTQMKRRVIPYRYGEMKSITPATKITYKAVKKTNKLHFSK